MKKFLITLVLFCSLLWLAPAYADNFLGNAQGNLDRAVSGVGFQEDITASVGSVVSVALSLVGTIFFVLTIYAGYLWMAAGGNEENVGKAKKILTAAVIGLVIVMSSYAITYFVTNQLGGATNGQPPAASRN